MALSDVRVPSMSEPRAADSAAARLRALRSSLGLSQEQLARRLGVSFATVNRWESGRTRLSARGAVALAELDAHAAALRADVAALPVAGSSFVGRERELAEVTRLIRQSRLVTLIGPGGAGKTRLAAEALRRNFADAGVVFVPLDRLSSPQALPTALAFRLRVADQPGTPLLESLRSALAQAPPLLLLVAPALHVHPATDALLRYIAPEIECELVGIGEKWREGIQVVFRKRKLLAASS